MAKNKLLQLIDSFPQKTVLVIGDTIIDHSTYGSVLGTSAETPTLVARELKQTFSLGGAFLVCRNLLKLKSKVHFFTLVGGDPEAAQIRRFSETGCTVHAFHDEGRKSTVKRRYWVDGYKLLQFDQLDDRPISEEMEQQILAAALKIMPSISSIILSDYRHGFLTPSLISSLLKLARETNTRSFVDSQVSQKSSNHHLYRGASVMCLNMKEAQCIDPHFALPDFQALKDKLNIHNIIVKRGDQGSVACLGTHIYQTPALSVQAVDTCGAGDAFLAALSLAELQENPQDALEIANIWAGLSTTTEGPQPPQFEQLLQEVEHVYRE